MGVEIRKRFLLLSVLLVAPSGSLALPTTTTPSSSEVTSPPVTTVTAGDVGGGGGGISSTTPVPVPQNVQDAATSQHPVVIPWGQGIAVGRSGQLPHGGFIYCAGCSPINPGQLVIPTNVPFNNPSASGVLPPPTPKVAHHQEGGYTIEQQLNGLGGGGPQEPGKGQKIWDDGSVPVQQMALHDDGRYSFSYDTAHSSRQEERNFEGGVSGSYSYTDPDGKEVHIVYTAGPMGYQAYGDNVPPQPALQLPQPVQDTLEVQMARQQFLDTYNRELARIERDREEAVARAATSTVAPERVESGNGDSEGAASEVAGSSDDDDGGDGGETQDDDAVVVSGKTEGGDNNAAVPLSPAAVVENSDGVTTDDQTDSIVVTAKGGDSQQQDDEVQPIDVRSELPNPAYQISIPIGVDGKQGLSVQGGARVQEEGGNSNTISQQGQQGQQQNVGTKSNLQPYFYYVSTGGQPYYVTSNSAGFNSPYPTSLKATLLGARPLAAVHDAQVPNRSGQQQQNSASPPANRPVFLDLENGLKLDQQSQQQQGVNIINPANLFTLSNNQNQSPLLGQLVPLGLSQGNTATFGYIPALIFNNNNNGQAQQSSQGSQSSSQQQFLQVPLLQQPQQQQQQQQQQQVPSLSNQPVIVLASKK